MGNRVYYIDEIPCVINSIKSDYALVEVIEYNGLNTSSMYVAKKDGFFAHGHTLEEAIKDANEKWMVSQTVEEKIEQFKIQFKKGILYKAQLFYDWHTLLTGSCKAGKDMWISQKGISLEGDMTVAQFIDITKNEYGAEIIRRLQ